MSDLIDRQMLKADLLCEDNAEHDYCFPCKKILERIDNQPAAQPERPEQDILAWLLAYHMKSFDLKGRYLAHEVIGWLVHDFATAYMAER